MLVTAFAPFKGRTRNGSGTVLRWLRRRWSGLGAISRILPVEWDAAPSILRRLIDRAEPQVIVALGEGQPERIAVETRAQNGCRGIDERGCERFGEPIDAAASAFRHASLIVEESWGAPPGIPLVRSDDAGCFLCNRILWEILARKPRRGGFIHLPPQGEASDREYAATFGPFVLEVLRRNRNARLR